MKKMINEPIKEINNNTNKEISRCKNCKLRAENKCMLMNLLENKKQISDDEEKK